MRLLPVMLRHRPALLLVLAGACREAPPPVAPVETPDAAPSVVAVPPPAPAAGPAEPPAQPGCGLDAYAAAWPAFLERATKGERVVAVDGCSLFDGELLVKGWPDKPEDARALMTMAENCEATLKLPQGQVRLKFVDKDVWVAEHRSVTDDALDKDAKDAVQKMNLAMVQAARCPEPDKRLRTEQDGQVALSYALAANALQRMLADGSLPGPGIQNAMDKVCRSDEAKKKVTIKGSPEPIAAMARVLAGSFTVFKAAADGMKAKDAGLAAVLPSAQKVLKDAPQGNLQGACAVWSMVEGTRAALMKGAKAAEKPRKGAGKK